MKVLLIRGPGAHFNLIFDALLNNNIELEYIEFSPVFKKIIAKNGKILDIQYNLFYNYIDKGLSFFFVKIFSSKVYYNRVLHLFHSFILWFENTNSDIIISCPQLSYFIFKKYVRKKKLLLESPMNHAEYFYNTLQKEYTKNEKQDDDNLNYFDVKMIKKEINLANQINVVSNFSKSTYIQYGVNSNKINVINLYSQFSQYKPTLKEKYKKFTILFIGRIGKQKGIHYLIQTLKKVEFDYDLILIGNIVNKDIGNEIRNFPNAQYHKTMEKDQLIDYYRRSHLLILPSVQETFGLVLLESLLNGTPILASDKTGINDLIDTNSNFVFSNNDEFSDKLNSIYANYQTVLTNIQDNTSYLSKFNKTNFEKNYIQILKNLYHE